MRAIRQRASLGNERNIDRRCVQSAHRGEAGFIEAGFIEPGFIEAARLAGVFHNDVHEWLRRIGTLWAWPGTKAGTYPARSPDPLIRHLHWDL
jgi:hypothetical protein